MSATAAADRKAAERERKAAAGLVRVEVWIRADQADRLRKYARRLQGERP